MMRERRFRCNRRRGKIASVSSQNIALQPACRGDAPAIASMSRDLVEAGLGWQYRSERIRRLIDDPETVTLVARDGERTIGFAIMTFGEERAHLVLLAVCPDCRRRGIARRMARWLLASATTAGIASVHVELRAGNEAAYAFYRALGFSETLRLPGYYRGRETAIRMLRMLRIPGMSGPTWRAPDSCP
jgi:[ribosomal protein S18]-alanine N-acetyltransferase